MTFSAITALMLLTLVPAALLWFIWHKYKRHTPNQIFLTEQERQLHQQVFYELDPVEFGQLMQIAFWREVKSQEVLVRQGDSVDHLSLVFSGRLSADFGRNRCAEIGPGQFIGEMSFVSGHPGSVTVYANQDTIVLQWPKEQLKALLVENKILGNYFHALFQRDMIKKLEQ